MSIIGRLKNTFRPYHGPKGKILVADHRPHDLLNSLENAKKILGTRKYDYYTASTAKEALDLAKKEKPDLFISCFNYNDMRGSALFRKIHKINENTKIFVKSSYFHDKGDKSRKAGIKKIEKECGADKYVYGGGDPPEYGDINMIEKSIKAMAKGKEPPSYYDYGLGTEKGYNDKAVRKFKVKA